MYQKDSKIFSRLYFSLQNDSIDSKEQWKLRLREKTASGKQFLKPHQHKSTWQWNKLWIAMQHNCHAIWLHKLYFLSTMFRLIIWLHTSGHMVFIMEIGEDSHSKETLPYFRIF